MRLPPARRLVIVFMLLREVRIGVMTPPQRSSERQAGATLNRSLRLSGRHNPLAEVFTAVGQPPGSSTVNAAFPYWSSRLLTVAAAPARRSASATP
jgi:hypothetical protein